MMKRFEKSGKIFGLALVAVALVFAGCAEGTNPSSEGSIMAAPEGSVVPMKMEDGQLYIGDSGQFAKAAEIDGVPIEVATEGACVDNGNGADCGISITNMSMDNMYLANVYVYLMGSSDPDPTINNADIVEGTGCTGSGVGDVGVNVGIENAGITYVSTGTCGALPDNSDAARQREIILPNAGAGSKMTAVWEFTGEAVPYTFNAVIMGEAWPWNPLGADGVVGGGDDDTRYDFQDRTTYMVKLTDTTSDLLAAAKKTVKRMYHMGSTYRSALLAGQGSANPSRLDVLNGDKFGVHAWAEYADRIESQVVGNHFANESYEYLSGYGYTLRWDPAVLSMDGAFGLNMYYDSATAAGHNPAVPHFALDASPMGSGWVSVYISSSEAFGTLAYYSKYSDQMGNFKLQYSTGYNPAFGGHFGIAHFDLPTGTSVNGGFMYHPNTVLIQEGVDDAADFPMGLVYLDVIGSTGDYSEIRIDANPGWTMFYSDTNGTFAGGQDMGSTDDIVGYCFPQPGCEVLTQSDGETPNPNGLQNGGYQAWNVHVVVN